MSTQAGRFTSGNVIIEKQSIGSVGAQNNSQGALEASDFPGGTASFFHLDGDALDDSANTNNLTVVGNTSFEGTGFFGRNNIATFSKGSDYLVSTDSFFNIGDTDQSFGGWFYLTSYESYLFNIGSAVGDRVIQFYVAGSGQMRIQATDIAGAFPLNQFIGTIPLNQWFHTTVTYTASSNTIILYYNGVLQRTFTQLLRTAATARFAIGQSYGGPGNISGRVQDVFFVSGDVLSADSVNKIYSKRYDLTSATRQLKAGHVLTSSSFPPIIPSLLSFYNLTGLDDDSTNSRTLTNNNSVTFTGDDIFGVNSGIAEFNGANSLDYNTDTFFTDGLDHGWAMGGWFRVGNWSDGGTLMAIRENAPNLGPRIETFADEIVFSASEDGSTGIVWRTDVDFEDGSWHHVVMAYDQSNFIGYIDGVRVANLASSVGQAAISAPFSIGSRYSGGSPGGYLIDGSSAQDVFFSSVTLTDADIRKIYAAKYTHNLGTAIEKQDWVATTVNETGNFAGTVIDGFVAAQDTNDLYIDFGDTDPGEQVEIKLK